MNTAPTKPRKRVALLVETSLSPGREILRGIARYAHQSDDWQLYHVPRSLLEGVPDWMRTWEGDGFIARIQDVETMEMLKKTALPVVDTLGVIESSPFPLVHVDDNKISALVAEHFLQREFRDFAFYGFAGEVWSERRRDGFKERCQLSGARSFHVLENTSGHSGRFRRRS